MVEESGWKMVEQIACFQEIGYMCTLEAKKEGCGDYSF